MYQRININSKKELAELKEKTILTLVGMIDSEDNIKSIFEYFDETTGMKEYRYYLFKGRLMNSYCELKGENKYPNDLNFIGIDIDDMTKPSVIITKRFEIGARWLDDIIDNNLILK